MAKRPVLAGDYFGPALFWSSVHLPLALLLSALAPEVR
jgi:hypothetical protein